MCRSYTVSAQSHKTDSHTHAGKASLYTPSRTFAYTQRGTRPQTAHSLPNRDNSSYFTTDGFLPQLSDIASWQHDRNKALPALLTACVLCLRRYSALSLHAWFYSARAHVCVGGWSGAETGHGFYDYYSQLRKLSQAEMLQQTRPLRLELALQRLVIEFLIFSLLFINGESLTNGFPMCAVNYLEKKKC